MTDAIINLIMNQFGTGTVAVFALVMLREAYKNQGDDKKLLIEALTKNADALSALVSISKRVETVISGCEDNQKSRRD